MADESKHTRILRIELDEALLDSSRDKVIGLGKSIKDLSDTQKAAKKNGEEFTKEFVDREAQIKALTKEMNQNKEVLKQGVTIANTAVKSNEQLRATLSVLTKQYDGMSEIQKKNSKAGKELQERILGITNELKDSEGAVGNFRRNVGDYKGAFKDAVGGINVFGQSLGGLFKMILTNPIGLLFLAVVGLVKAFSTLEPVANAIKGVMAAVSSVVGTLVGSIKSFFDAVMSGKGLLEAFGVGFDDLGSRMVESAKGAYDLVQALDALGDAQREQNVLNAEAEAQEKNLLLQARDRTKSIQERLGLLQKAGDIEEKNFQQQLALAKQAEALAQKEFDDAKKNNKLNDEIEDKLAAAKTERIKLESESADVLERIAVRRNDLLQKEQDEADKAAAAQTARLAKIADEKEKADAKEKERIDALRKQFEEQQAADAKTRQDFADERELARLNEFDKEKKLLDNKVNELRLAGVSEIELAQFIADERNRINKAADKADLDARLAKIDKEAELAKAQLQLLDLDEKKKTDLIRAAETERLNAKIQAIDLEMQQLTASTDMTVVIDQEKNDQLVLLKAQLVEQLKALGVQIETDEQGSIKKIQDTAKGAVTGTLGVAADILSGLQNIAANNIKLIEEQAKAAGKTDEEISKMTLEARKEAKSLAIAAAIIQTFQAAIAAYSSGSAVPVVGVALGPIAAAAALAFGFAQVDAIQSQKLAKGGKIKKAGLGAKFGVFGGKPHSQGGNKYYGEDGSVIETEKDELWAVVNKRSTGMLAALSNLNVAGGGVQFADGGLVNKLASGGFANPITSGMFEQADANRNLVNKINNLQPVLVLQDFQAVEGQAVRTQQNFEID